ncbi:MAG: VWA domain-containing protein, partial [Gemmatimonadetes bacterium]|nr:VWA domain-containing protein [Gemmatimonadota bacterium]
RPSTAPAGDGRWAERVLACHAAAVRRVRRDFERLRPRRMLLRAQPDGAEVDIDAYVAAYADARAGGALEHRLYRDARPLRRDAATLLLVDASASTDGWLSGDRRIIDVEKEALLVAVEALAAAGDPHAVLAFSGEGPARVELRTLKRFDEPAGAVVRGRVAALEPDGYTRAGAALRHATALLGRQPARHRLLLLVSDGRPNDVDAYAGRYGVEDTRQAVVEARLEGIHVFCLTVDREAPRYAAHVFGPGGYTVLQRPERLAGALVDTLRSLLRR